MTELLMTKPRRIILEACAAAHGVDEAKWWRDAASQKAMEFLVQQKLLERRVGDGGRAFVNRLFLTERGRAALRGDMLTKI